MTPPRAPAAGGASGPAIAVEGLQKRFGGTIAVDDL